MGITGFFGSINFDAECLPSSFSSFWEEYGIVFWNARNGS